MRLAAPRRYGKTSLLLADAGRLAQTDWRTASSTCRASPTSPMSRGAWARPTAPLDPGWMRAHLGPLLSRLGISISASGPTVSLGPRPPAPDNAAAESALHALLDLPLTLWQRDATPTLVVLDEFQDLLVARGDLDGLLRSRIQYHGDAAAYVYAGSEPSMMRELFDGRERPLFGRGGPAEPLPTDETLADLDGRFVAEGLDPGTALGALVAFAAGHPQRVMLLAYLLADRLADGQAGTQETATAVVSDALDRTGPAHQALWQQLGRTERVVLGAVADGTAPTSRALAAEHQLSRTALQAAADRLADQGHLRQGRAQRGRRPAVCGSGCGAAETSPTPKERGATVGTCPVTPTSPGPRP